MRTNPDTSSDVRGAYPRPGVSAPCRTLRLFVIRNAGLLSESSGTICLRYRSLFLIAVRIGERSIILCERYSHLRTSLYDYYVEDKGGCSQPGDTTGGDVDMATEDRKTAQHRSTQRVLDILTTLSEADGGLTMAEICRALEAPKSSLFPILHTMADANFIDYDADTTRYTLGLRSFLLASSYERTGGIIDIFTSSMRKLVDAVEETSQLGTLDHGRVLYIAKVDSAQPVQLKSNIGMTLGVSYTAIGKVLMSDKTDDEIKRLVGEPLTQPTPKALTTMDDLLREVHEVRTTGFGYDREETTPGVQCIAVPVLSHGRVRYGISVTTPSYRLSDEKEALIKSELTKAKERVERVLAS